MKQIAFSILICAAWVLFGANSMFAQTYTDKCHVYLVNEEAAQRFYKEADLNALAKMSKQEQAAVAVAAGLGTTFDEFTTQMGEEQLTTRTYAFPNSGQIITASVYYTDEMMYSNGVYDSMLLGIVVDEKAQQNAISALNGVVAEISDLHVNAVRVKQKIKVDGQAYLIGLECRRHKSGSK